MEPRHRGGSAVTLRKAPDKVPAKGGGSALATAGFFCPDDKQTNDLNQGNANPALKAPN